MALVPLFHVVASEYPVDPTTQNIPMGAFVALNTNGSGVHLATSGDLAIIGIAGDNKSSSESTMPDIAPGWQNRVSDMFDETKASGKMTVYHSGGEFQTDQWNGLTTSNVNSFLKVSVAGDSHDGMLILDGTSKTANSVAVLEAGPGLVASGVPGTDINGSTALGGANSNQYITDQTNHLSK